ncbi:MAG: DNA-3-methyladenine glycosylase [Candidatus Solibacter sp.]|nr:DNA-3-methyladenine glycosylase [Candidatus Solibacter sp.]
MQHAVRPGRILPRSFYTRPAIEVARDLLGKVLVHGPTAGIIVETEAYLGGDDLASHSAAGVTDRTRVIFGPPGHAYVYFIYGMYECLNLVAEPAGQAGCVLIRALEPLAGLDLMHRRRPAARKPEHLANGPGKLTLAMAITRAQNGADVTRGPLVVRAPHTQSEFEIAVTPRVGITKCADLPLRFLIASNRFVSPTPKTRHAVNMEKHVRLDAGSPPPLQPPDA